ncbi:MAG: hypothetical protein ABWZ26_02235 [Candidatus Nanopelagicales bacterium]
MTASSAVVLQVRAPRDPADDITQDMETLGLDETSAVVDLSDAE